MTSDLQCEDWRHASADVVARLLDRERLRWIDALHWDMSGSFDLLERARLAGHAAGFVASDRDGEIAGWTYYVLQNRRLQIGGLVAASVEVTRRLVDAVLRAPEAEMAADVLCFALPSSPALEGALTRRRFDVRRYLYLRRTLSPGSLEAPAVALAGHVRPWAEDDAVASVRLFARAYAGVPGARAFAPRGTLEEWAHYLAQLIKTPVCGRFLPAASLVAQHPADDRLRGVALTTALQRDTAHIAQIAIDPAYRRRGLARALVQEASRRAAAEGFWRMTLLVAEENVEARALYASLGFEEHAAFLYATRGAPNRLRGQRGTASRELAIA